jgi:hypothetical protein
LYSLADARGDQTGESNYMISKHDIPRLLKERDELDSRRSEIDRSVEKFARTTLLASARVAGLDVARMPDWLLTWHLLDLQERSRLPGFTEWVERQPRLSPEMSARLERELRWDQAGSDLDDRDEGESVRPVALCLPSAPSDQDRVTLEQFGLKQKIKLGSRSPIEIWEGFCNPSDLKQVLASYGGRIIDLPPRKPSRSRKQSVRKNPASWRHKARHAVDHRAAPTPDLANASHTGGGPERSRDRDPQDDRGVDRPPSLDLTRRSPSGLEPQGTSTITNAEPLRSPDPYQRAGALGPIRVPAAGQPAGSGDSDPPADEDSPQSSSTVPVTESQS